MISIIIADKHSEIINQDTNMGTALSTLIGIALLFVKEYVSAIVKAYPPNVPKHMAFIRKYSISILAYIFPIITVTFLMVISNEVTKWLVLFMCLNCILIFTNIIIDLYKFIKNKHEANMKIHGMTIQTMTELQNINNDSMKNISDVIKTMAAAITDIYKRIG